MRMTGSKEDIKRILMDLDVVQKSHECPHIVTCYGYFVHDGEVWICMELMATCFDKLLRYSKKPVPEHILGKLAVAILHALKYLKDMQGVIHRDVKPSNMLLDWYGVIKLCDFGISGRLVDSKAKTRSAGCAGYMAPERIEPPDPERPAYDIRADVWSLGISMVELAMAKYPYGTCNTDFEILAKVVTEDAPTITPEMGFTTSFCYFIEKCLIKDCSQRPRYNELLEDPFIKTSTAMEVDVRHWLSNVLSECRELEIAPPVPPRPPPPQLT